MIIESKKTGMRQHVSEQEWLQMKATGDSMHFNVIKRSDDESKPEKKPLPFVLEHIVKQGKDEIKKHHEESEETKHKPKRNPNNQK